MGDERKVSPQEFYGDAYGTLKAVQGRLDAAIEGFMLTHAPDDETKAVVYHTSRIKSPESLMRKAEKHGLEPTYEAALDGGINDVIGIRVVCAFNDDVYSVAHWLMSSPEFELVKEKDYIAYPKPSGYRSLHLILRIVYGIGAGMTVEVQIRTIAMDFWSTLDHKVRYKKAAAQSELISRELRRCADEIASVDINMKAIRDLIRNIPDDAPEG